MDAWGVSVKKRVLFRGFGAFKRDVSATTAVEFALLAFPFFMTLLGIFDISTMYFASTTLEKGTYAVARKVKTGEVVANSMTAQQFKQELCDEVSGMLACDQRLQVDVRTFQQFNQANLPPPLNPDGTIDNSQFQFNPGNAGDVVLVRTFYVWSVATPFWGQLFSNMAGGTFLMQAAAAFRNEPFAAGSGSWNGS